MNEKAEATRAVMHRAAHTLSHGALGSTGTVWGTVQCSWRIHSICRQSR